MSLSHHPHVHVHVSVSPRLAHSFYFPLFLPHSFPFLLHLKFVDYNLLRTPHKESMDLSDEFLLSTRNIGLVQRCTGKEIAKRSPHVAVRLFTNCVLLRVPKTRVVQKSLPNGDRFSGKKGGKKGEHNLFFFCKHCLLIVAVITFLCIKCAVSFLPCRVNHMCWKQFLETSF